MRLWLAVVVVATPATAERQFDLICAGTTRTVAAAPTPQETTKPFSEELRIDLATKRYCIGSCLLPRPIYAIVANSIVFEQSVDEPAYGRKAVHHWVYRPTGEYLFYVSDVSGASTSTEARCKAAPFKGLPIRPAKF